jgi:hypothetical protein
MLQNMTSIQQWKEWDTKDAIWCNIDNGSRVHNTFRNHEGDIIKFMADGRDNVSMQPVPMSNKGSKRQDRTYKVVAHTTETQTKIYFYVIVWIYNWEANIDSEESWDHDNLHDEENKQYYSSLEKEVSQDSYKCGSGIKPEGDSTQTHHNIITNTRWSWEKRIIVSTWLKRLRISTDQTPCHITKLCEILSGKNMWNTLQKEEELPEWAILLPSVQDIQDWRPKWINRIFGNQDWKETRWDTRMNSANPDIANFEKSQVRRRGAQRRTKHPNIKYHHWREEVRKEIISISIYHTW